MSLFRNPEVRPPAVASLFYPGDARTLAEEVSSYLDQTQGVPLAPGFPKALIVPHAGFIYSGPVAASAYDRLRPARGIVRRVVILGPCHRVPVRGLALPRARAFDTPLGRIPLDEEAIASIRGLPQVVESAATHAEEHALEVQLPFLQRVLGGFSLVPLVVGDAAPEKVADVLERIWGGTETLIVISSDLSHYHSYERARSIDGATVRAILGLDTGISHEQACGATPVAGLLVAAKRKGLAASYSTAATPATPLATRTGSSATPPLRLPPKARATRRSTEESCCRSRVNRSPPRSARVRSPAPRSPRSHGSANRARAS